MYTYDDFGRLIETENGGESVTYTYDNIGNVLTMTDSSGTTTYTYDSMGRILTKNHSVTGTVTYTYDDYTDVPYGLVSETTTDPKGNTVEKWYDSLDKIYKVIDGNDVTVYNYYENDQLSSVTVPGGTTTSYTYDEEGNLLTLTNKKSDGTVLDSFTYTYSDDTLGVKNQVSKTETVGGVQVGTTSYEYDGLGRLTKVVTPDGVQNVYTYDGAGNRLTKTSTAGEESAITEYTYDEQNRLLNTSAYVTGGTDEVNTYYGYDNNGNQISRWTQTEKTSGTEDAVTLSELGINAADETAVYEYDVFNRLTAIYQGDTIIENTYDGAGDNISRVEDGVSVYYVYDGNTVILELDGNGAEKARNVYGRNLIARESDGEKAIYRYNGHGDVITIMGTNGTAISSYEYDEFGNETASTGTFDNPYRYAGYEYLDEVELYDLNARYYDPSIARFLTEDPYYNLGNRVMGVYEINVPNVYSIMQANALYAYCGNNPVMFVDPSGQLAWDMDAGYNLVGDYYTDDNWSKTGYEIWDWETNPTGPDPFITYEEGDPEWVKSTITYYREEYETAVEKQDWQAVKTAYAKIYEVKQNAYTDKLGIVLEVPIYNQLDLDHGEYVCWATVASMITSYYENDQIDRTKQIATSLDPFDYNQPRSFDELTGHVNFNIVMTGPTSLSALQYNLENDNLPVARIGWQNDQGHFILIVGVINVNGEYGVLYNDPWNGVQQYLPFEKFSGEGTLQDGTWTHTALTYKK